MDRSEHSDELKTKELLQRFGMPPRLQIHHQLVTQTAADILKGIQTLLPAVSINHETVLVGASLHDIGKLIHPEELSSHGNQHEEAGYLLLKKHGYPEAICRIALSHGQWAEMEDVGLEDLIVALADTVWKGCRNEQLETVVVKRISTTSGLEPWSVFDKLDGLLTKIASDGEERLFAQAKSSS